MSKRGKVLVLGCGNSRKQAIQVGSEAEIAAMGPNFDDNFERVVTIDMDPACKPTIVWDLEKMPWPIKKESCDEVHAYEVLEHLGTFDEVHAYQVLCNLGGVGDWRFFFALWRQIWDCLKPGGLVCATTPWWESIWAWQDPGHRRVYSQALLVYLNQDEYISQIGRTAMTDYRSVWPPPYSFALRMADMYGDDPKLAGFQFILQKEIKNYKV